MTPSQTQTRKGLISLKCIRVGSPIPPRWMTFYPRAVFSSFRVCPKKFPRNSWTISGAGFCMMFHSVRDLSQASSRRGRCRGIRSREVRISSFRVHDPRFLLSSRSTRGDSARFLRTCEFEGSLVREWSFRRVVIFSSRENWWLHIREKEPFV